jgi:dihydroorotate dehydrogenase
MRHFVATRGKTRGSTSLYQFVRPILFSCDAEKSHDLVIRSLEIVSNSPSLCGILNNQYGNKVPSLPVELMGMRFKHPIGLAAGLDKNARAMNAFAALGFSGVELGTVTPEPQPGQDKPRVFRLVEDEALINRMGFNSTGVAHFVKNIENRVTDTIIGVNIGKNRSTVLEDAASDYTRALKSVYKKADYITVNISSPSTESLRDLQHIDKLDTLLLALKGTQEKLQKVTNLYVPIALKIAPDLEGEEVEAICELVQSHEFDAVIATNTTVSRPVSLKSKLATEAGGLSGKPLKDKSTEVIKRLFSHLRGEIPIIGVGGITDADDAWEKLTAGADYLQIYSSFIYHGPGVIREIVEGLADRVIQSGHTDLGSALRASREN